MQSMNACIPAQNAFLRDLCGEVALQQVRPELFPVVQAADCGCGRDIVLLLRAGENGFAHIQQLSAIGRGVEIDGASPRNGHVAFLDGRLPILQRGVNAVVAGADHVLIAGSDMALFADSLVAPLSVINALIVALGLAKKDEVSDYLNTLESVWDATETYFDRPAEEV